MTAFFEPIMAQMLDKLSIRMMHSALEHGCGTGKSGCCAQMRNCSGGSRNLWKIVGGKLRIEPYRSGSFLAEISEMAAASVPAARW